MNHIVLYHWVPNRRVPHVLPGKFPPSLYYFLRCSLKKYVFLLDSLRCAQGCITLREIPPPAKRSCKWGMSEKLHYHCQGTRVRANKAREQRQWPHSKHAHKHPHTFPNKCRSSHTLRRTDKTRQCCPQMKIFSVVLDWKQHMVGCLYGVNVSDGSLGEAGSVHVH